MNEVIDFECDTPTKEAVEDTIALIHAGRGFDKEGYAQLMAPGLGRSAQRQEREVRRNATSAPHPRPKLPAERHGAGAPRAAVA